MWASVRALYMLLLLMNQTRHTIIFATSSAKGAKSVVFSLSGRFNPVTGSVLFPSSALSTTQLSASKTSMEIREEDFSFQDGAKERPSVQVVTKDVKTADIFSVMQVIGSEEEIATEHGTSWWKDAVTENFNRLDVIVLALIAIFILRVVVFVLQITWKLMILPFQWYNTQKGEEGNEMDTSHEAIAIQLRRQLKVVRFCHLQFLLVIEKLKREMKDEASDNTQQMVAELILPHYTKGTKATLTDILATVQSIQTKDRTFGALEIENLLIDINQDATDEEDVEFGLPQAWKQLYETYASFVRIQATILRRQNSKKGWQLQQHHEKTSGWRKHRPSSNDDLTDEVLQELHQLTKELPQGFTADMFTSLGNAMHKKEVASEPEISPASSQVINADRSRISIVASIPKAAQYSATAQKAA
ncbi:uncharacterized protein PHALS_05331 [Plasmopara halstedii]|uniref:Uncharacterized protein n=1 Tax=Plasmopara halstedii TaxID=4781 RepID=A0A0P1ABI3_PLAHL|nr:uncharacterized protein PHALS_05331 [Plasmopara halstedii]CEG37551.1 hypothetical protein PHALS_05331 [Plasmopara halstedii]|eukprot:XP_024573920.1 hypothetical protein PHALS_05331 [Plasmopara halstedii]